MRPLRKALFAGILGIMILAGLYVNFALSAPGAAPVSSAGCVAQPDGTYVQHLQGPDGSTISHVCDRVDYTLFKRGMVAYIDPYFYHLIAEGWTFLNYSRGGSFFTFETHNLITGAGVVAIQNNIHGTATLTNCSNSATGCTQFVAQGLGLSSSATAPAWNDETALGTYPTAGPCSNDAAVGEITQFQLTRTVGTYTSGTVAQNGASPNGGTISPQISATWTATGSQANMQVGCAWIQDATNSNAGTGSLYAENTFSAVNLNSGDQLTITWTFTYSG